MKNRLIRDLACGGRRVFSCLCAGLAAAGILPWLYSVPVGAQEELLITQEAFCYEGHYYMLYQDLNSMEISWEAAQRLCAARGGHLATLTSAEESKAVFQNYAGAGYDQIFFGLVREGEGWKWVTDEPVEYTDWADSEPSSLDEKYGQFLLSAYPDGGWNDSAFSGDAAYLCEWDSGEYWKDTIEYTEEGDHALPDNTLTFGNDMYKVFHVSLTAEEADSFCKEMGGHLVFIESAEEQDFLTQSILQMEEKKNMYWIGAKESGEQWNWDSGGYTADITYSNWSPGEPDNPDGESVHAAMNIASGSFSPGKWVAESNIGAEYRESDYYVNYGFICEWEISCVSDQGSFVFHVAGETVTTKEPTCTETGTAERYCVRCGELYDTVTLAVKEHNLQPVKMFGVFNFFIIPGLVKEQCAECGESSFSIHAMTLIIEGAVLLFLIVGLVAFVNARKAYNENSEEYT